MIVYWTNQIHTWVIFRRLEIKIEVKYPYHKNMCLIIIIIIIVVVIIAIVIIVIKYKCTLCELFPIFHICSSIIYCSNYNIIAIIILYYCYYFFILGVYSSIHLFRDLYRDGNQYPMNPSSIILPQNKCQFCGWSF